MRLNKLNNSFCLFSSANRKGISNKNILQFKHLHCRVFDARFFSLVATNGK